MLVYTYHWFVIAIGGVSSVEQIEVVHSAVVDAMFEAEHDYIHEGANDPEGSDGSKHSSSLFAGVHPSPQQGDVSHCGAPSVEKIEVNHTAVDAKFEHHLAHTLAAGWDG